MPLCINMATSLDGKIAPADRRKMRMGTDRDIGRMDALRAWADVIVLGAGTVRAEDPPMEINDSECIRVRVEAGRPPHPAVAVVTGTLDLPIGRTFRTTARRLIITTEAAPEASPEAAERAEIWRIGRDRVDIPALVDRLRAEDLENILVEGGGEVGAEFLRTGLIDEIRLTLTPWLVGGDGAPTLADSAEAIDPPLGFEFSSIEAAEDEVFLTLKRAAAG